MTICVLATGSRGDVQPAVALCARLAACGHRARLVAPRNFAALAAGRGFEFAPMPVDAQEELRSEDGRFLLEGGGSLVRFVRWSARATRRALDKVAPSVWQACEDAELIVAAVLMQPLGALIAEARGIPCVHAFWAPMLAAADFVFATYERAPPPTPGFVNRGIFYVFEQAMWLAMRPAFAPQRRLAGLPPARWSPPLRAALKRREPVLLAYSETLLPRSREWGDNVEVTGWWFLDEGANWAPPPRLAAFLEAGPPPVYVGFGSMPLEDVGATRGAVLTAIRAVGARAVLSAGWGGLRGEHLPPGVIAIDEAPHDWLFPRMAAIVHHGGAGTTGAAARAGRPQVVTPFLLDQFPWARLVAAHGVAAAPVLHRTLTAEALAAALSVALGDAEMRRKAAALGERIRGEDGVGRAVAAIERAAVSRPAAPQTAGSRMRSPRPRAG